MTAPCRPDAWAILVIANPALPTAISAALTTRLTASGSRIRKTVNIGGRAQDIAREIRRAWYDGHAGVVTVGGLDERGWPKTVAALGMAWDRLAETPLLPPKIPLGATLLGSKPAWAIAMQDNAQATISLGDAEPAALVNLDIALQSICG